MTVCARVCVRMCACTQSLEQEAASARALQARLTALESEHTAQLQTSANLKRRVDGLLELVAEEQRQVRMLTAEHIGTATLASAALQQRQEMPAASLHHVSWVVLHAD